MPTIGWFEILLVVAVAIIVIGPKDFPFMLKKVGSWIGTTKRYINNIQTEVADLDIGSNEIEKPVEEKKEDIYENIDEMLGGTLSPEEEK